MHQKQSYVRMVTLNPRYTIEEYELTVEGSKIYDPIENRWFNSLKDWAIYMDAHNHDYVSKDKSFAVRDEDWK